MNMIKQASKVGVQASEAMGKKNTHTLYQTKKPRNLEQISTINNCNTVKKLRLFNTKVGI